MWWFLQVDVGQKGGIVIVVSPRGYWFL
jgi:hypothetical protein